MKRPVFLYVSALFASAWLTEAGVGKYNQECDISIAANNYIDWRDLKVFGENRLAGK